MFILQIFKKVDSFLFVTSVLLVLLSVLVLRSVAPLIFPQYYIFIFVGLIFFLIFLQVDFEVLKAFSKILYILSIVLLVIPLILGQVTRGAIRWIPVGDLTIQPSEIVRPFLILFFADYIIKGDMNSKKVLFSIVLLAVPVFLIIIQPSLGVGLLTALGYAGVLIASKIEKKYLFLSAVILLIIAPSLWFALAPYQKLRLTTFIDPFIDPRGAGYNSIQSMISVGSGKYFGRGLGKGVQTQLAFLPEKHTDFIFAAVSEEMGFLGAGVLLIGVFLFLLKIIKILEVAKGPVERAFISGVFVTFLAETIIHVGMNLGMLPITGVPLPLVSAGGSAFLATSITLAMIMNAKQDGLLR